MALSMLKKVLLATGLFCSITLVAHAKTSSSENAEQSPRFIIHLLDYLAHDYGGAVVNKKIISELEYAEQKEFVTKVYDLSKTLPVIKNNQQLQNKIAKLKILIEKKAEALDVALLARNIQRDLINDTKISLAPDRWPSLTKGKILFEQDCVSCHGPKGLGDGPSSLDLEIKPSNFHNPKRMNTISAFHIYNTIRLGVPGTSMVSWENFSDKEVWDLSFYVMSLRYDNETLPTKFNVNDITLLEAASLSDDELKEKIAEEDDVKKNIALSLIRNKNAPPSNGEFISIAKSYLDQAFDAYKKNLKDDAKYFALRAYLEGIEPIESMIKANNPSLVFKVEKEMGKTREIIASPKNSLRELSVQIAITKDVFTEVEQTIEARELSFGVAFSGSFAIILREGFEAVLIILTLLSVIKAFGNKKAALWVHAGWTSALFLGLIGWFLSGTLMKMSGASREVLEGITSAVAVFILLYFGFWLHRQTEISRWKKFINEKVQGAIDNKNLLGLFSISFISVFREAFETILFIRALWFQTNADGKNAISLGLLSALTLIFIFSYITLKFSKKLPVRQLFKISSILTSILALILSGKAIHSMQEAGILNVTSIPWNIRFDTIGFFPTWQTICAQVLTLLLTIILININTNKKLPS